jgi:predicted aspartyl protease
MALPPGAFHDGTNRNWVYLMQRVLAIATVAIASFTLLGAARPLAPSPMTTVKFRYVHHEIVVSATVDGKGPYAFLLDTGTTPSVVDAAVAKTLEIRANGPAARGSAMAGATTKAFPATLHGLRYGTTAIGPLDILVTDLSSVSKRLGVSLAGVLGSNFFDGRSIRIDYPCAEASLMTSHDDAPLTAPFELLSSGWIDVDDAWANGKRISAAIDTGNSGTPVVTKRGIAKLGLQQRATTGAQGSLSELRIGETRFGTPAVRFLSSSDDAFDINIGNRTLEKSVVTLDYLRGRLTIAKAHPC